MGAVAILGVIGAYFALLVLIARITSGGGSNSSFFVAGRSAPWYLVAFGMIGTSLSGVTFISVPGKVGLSGFSYLQVVIGYLFGYLAIALVLLPLFYRMQLTSIYTFLEQRLGWWAYKTGAGFFLLSRTVGSAARFYLVISVLHFGIFSSLGLPFFVSVIIGLALIWLYTFQGGLKTIIYTDTLQSLFMLLSLVISLWFIAQQLQLGIPQLFAKVNTSQYSRMWVWDYLAPDFVGKQLVAGALIAFTMTGLDQDMMQKNLACRNIGEAQKNMFWFCVALVVVNVLFHYLGAGLYLLAEAQAIALPAKSDQLFPLIALQHMPALAVIVFVLGIVAATYASTDSALAALTTSFCIDFLGFEKNEAKASTRTRTLVHVGFTGLMVLVVLLLRELDSGTLIDLIFTLAGYTYGPLLGLFTFGMATRRHLADGPWVLAVCLLAPVLTFLIAAYSPSITGYRFGFEVIVVNGLLVFLGLLLLSKKGRSTVSIPR